MRRFMDEGLPQGSYLPTCSAERLIEQRRDSRVGRVGRDGGKPRF